MPKAFTRAVSPRIAECELTHLQRVPIDAAKAAVQHASYEDALRSAGFEVIRPPELPEHPDGVFVEDTALILDGHAVILRPGAASRASETTSTASGLVSHFELHPVRSGFVDGGDVLRIGRTLFVGRSTRTDAEGIEALRQTVSAIGFEVVEAELKDCLHLKTGATLAQGKDIAVLVHNRACIDPVQFGDIEPLAVDPAEPGASNLVCAGDHLIMPAGNPRTAASLRQRGFDVIEVDVSELQKAEAGVTCMSLIAD